MMAFAAALAASVSFTAPVAVGPAASSTQVARVLSMQPDPGEGAWLQLAGPEGERLVRINEDGRVTPVELPPKLRGEELEITPLRNGWTVASTATGPGGFRNNWPASPSAPARRPPP
jgi:hypothetical protein